MISYNTAVKLKEAGFPQTRDIENPYPNYYTKDDRIRNPARDDMEGSWEDYIKIPTLSELIAECKVEFSICCYPARNELNPTPWYVIERPELLDMARQDIPEEAVANLYIALHVKQEKTL